MKDRFIEFLAYLHPELNTKWLKTGKGEMLISSYVNQSNVSGDNIQCTNIDVNKSQTKGSDTLDEAIRGVKTDIESIKAQINALSKKKPPSEPNIFFLLGAILVGSIIFFGVAVWANKQWNFGLSDNSIVIAFVGILATFIVISNYMQLKRTEDRVDDFKNDWEKTLNDLRSKMDDFQKRIEPLETFKTNKTLDDAMVKINKVLEKEAPAAANFQFSTDEVKK